MNFKVNEIFDSVQGEGVMSGSPATFIRLQGCPVGCSWCDSGPLADEMGLRTTNGLTKNTWGAGGVSMTVDEIMLQVHHHHVIITGGEPTIWNLDPLLAALHLHGHFTQLETSGFSDLKGGMIPHHITISPKPNLDFAIPPEMIRLASEVKWVVDESLTFEVVRDTWHSFGLAKPVFTFMPEGCPPRPEMCRRAIDLVAQGEKELFTREAWRVTDRLQYRLGVR